MNEQNPFNVYNLNRNFISPEGQNFILPSWIVDQFLFYSDRLKYEIIVIFKDETKEGSYLIEVEFSSNPNELPTVEFIENQILQVSTFNQSTLKTL
jgi:hypothetical protein